MKSKNRIIVSAVLISKDKKILLGKVRPGGVYPECWHIPGGGVELCETKIEALIREMKEEVGLDISQCPIKLISDSDTGENIKSDINTGEKFLIKMKFNTYQVDLKTNSDVIKISLNDDLTEFIWVSIKNLAKYKHTPPSQKLFANLGWL